MRGVAPILCLLALAAPSAAHAQAPPLRARLVACTTGPQPAERTAAFLGSMPAFPGVRRMAMWSPPRGCSAAMIAVTIAGGGPTFGDSPTPLAPSGWCGHGVTVAPSSKSGHSSAVGIR